VKIRPEALRIKRPGKPLGSGSSNSSRGCELGFRPFPKAIFATVFRPILAAKCRTSTTGRSKH
jgi:hypothetical protein